MQTRLNANAIHEKPTNTIQLEGGAWGSRGSDGISPLLMENGAGIVQEVLII